MHFLMPQVFASHAHFKDWFSNPLSGMVEGQEAVEQGEHDVPSPSPPTTTHTHTHSSLLSFYREHTHYQLSTLRVSFGILRDLVLACLIKS